jgi:Putative zinc-finger
MCDLARSRLIAWMDGELEGAEAEAVKTHAAACPECGEQLGRLRAISRDITDYCAAVSSEQQRRRWWIPAAAAAALILAAGLVWMREQPAPVTVVKLVVTPSVTVARNHGGTEVPRRLKSAPRRPRAPTPKLMATARGEPGLTVVIRLDEVLPFGAAPPGAVLVGNVTFDAGGQLSTIRLE